MLHNIVRKVPKSFRRILEVVRVKFALFGTLDSACENV